jgi:hypothetical protein
LDLQELLDRIDALQPNVIGLKVPERLAAAVVRAAFQVIQNELRNAGDGQVPVTGLGVFRVRKVEKGEGAEAGKRKVVIFSFPGME